MTTSAKRTYLLLRLLGRGGMAEVYEARKRAAEGVEYPVAIKRILTEYRQNKACREAFRQMFITEAHLAARLRHDNIVSIFDFEEDVDGVLFLVMDFIDGVDLNALLRTGHLPPPIALVVASEILQGLAHAHDLPSGEDGVRGIIHRDVSPANILLSWDGAVKVSDFGIAKARATTEVSGSARSKGKFAYLSPEYAQGRPLDGRSDLFSVGVTLWEMLVGEPLFRRATDAATMHGVVYELSPSPRSMRSEIPEDIERVTMCLLEKARDNRYANARAAIAALKDCAAFPKHGRDQLSALLRERFPDGVPQRPDGQMAPVMLVASGAIVEADPTSGRATNPNVDPIALLDVHPATGDLAELAVKRSIRPSPATDALPAKTRALRLPMVGAIAATAAITSAIATTVLLRGASSGDEARPPAPLAPLPPPTTPTPAAPPSSVPPAFTPSSQPETPPALAPDEAPQPSAVAARRGPAQPTSGTSATAPASARQADREPRSSPAQHGMIMLDLDALKRH